MEGRGLREQGVVEASGERVQYQFYTVDARTEEQRERNKRQGRLDGYIVVIVPGHGQTVDGPRKLVSTAAQLSRSRIAWCVDPIPVLGGDRTEGKAIAEIVRYRIASMLATADGSRASDDLPARAAIAGWSHGASEALCAAAYDPHLFPQCLGLCPTGLVDRPLYELIYSFVLEAVRVSWSALRRWDWICLGDIWRVGLNFVTGSLRDLVRSRSPSRLAEDLTWACRRVSGEDFDYSGEVVLLFGKQDTVIRWQDVFPGVEQPDQIAGVLEDYRRMSFPQAERLSVGVIDGNHLGPESDAAAFLRVGLGLLDQLDRDETLSLDQGLEEGLCTEE